MIRKDQKVTEGLALPSARKDQKDIAFDQYAYPKAATAYSLLSSTNRITRYVSDSTDKERYVSDSTSGRGMSNGWKQILRDGLVQRTDGMVRNHVRNEIICITYVNSQE